MRWMTWRGTSGMLYQGSGCVAPAPRRQHHRRQHHHAVAAHVEFETKL
jgi:hypothetical protein